MSRVQTAAILASQCKSMSCSGKLRFQVVPAPISSWLSCSTCLSSLWPQSSSKPGQAQDSAAEAAGAWRDPS